MLTITPKQTKLDRWLKSSFPDKPHSKKSLYEEEVKEGDCCRLSISTKCGTPPLNESLQTKITHFFALQRRVVSSKGVCSEIKSLAKKFGSCQIPYYFRILSDHNEWRGVHYPLFEIIMKFLTVRECQTKFARVCKSWKHLDFKMFCSYSSFKSIENSRFTAKELKVVLKKASKTLPHVRIYKEIIRRDFRNQFEFFNQNVTLQIKVADSLLFQIKDQSLQQQSTKILSTAKGIKAEMLSMVKTSKLGYENPLQTQKRLYQTFKIKALGVNSSHNFLSDKSFQKVCTKSKDSLEDLAIKNCIHLSIGCLSENIGQLKRLLRLDLSYSKQIDDSVLKIIALELKSLRKLCLRFLSLITAQSAVLAIDNLKFLEGLDLSGCFNMNLDLALLKMRENTSLRCLLIEYLLIQPYHLNNLRYSNVQTLSLFYCRTVTDSHLDVIKQIKNLRQLNLKDCLKITETGICEMIENKAGDKFSCVQLSDSMITEAIKEKLQ